jgi:hypothetical protein
VVEEASMVPVCGFPCHGNSLDSFLIPLPFVLAHEISDTYFSPQSKGVAYLE